MRRPLAALPLSLLLLVLVATPAFAHASFDVTQLPAGSTQELTLRVPLERDAVNELVEVLVPGAFTVATCDGTEGWTCQKDATQDGDTVLTFSREAGGPGDTERFSLSLTAPDEEGVYRFPTIQTYDDGEEVAWVNEPGTDRPAPRIQVGDATTEVEYAGDGTPHTELATEEPAEDPTDEPTEAPTDAPVEDATDVPVEEPTEVPADDVPTADTADDTADVEDGGGPWVPVVLGLLVLGGGAAVALRRRS